MKPLVHADIKKGMKILVSSPEPKTLYTFTVVQKFDRHLGVYVLEVNNGIQLSAKATIYEDNNVNRTLCLLDNIKITEYKPW